MHTHDCRFLAVPCISPPFQSPLSARDGMLPFQRFASPLIILVSVASLAACEDPIVPPGGASAPQDPAAA